LSGTRYRWKGKAMASTLRLPQDLDDKLSTYCERVGATKNRVTCLALRAYLGEEPAPRVAPDRAREPDGPLSGERLGAVKLVRALGNIGLDDDEIAEVTGLDGERVAAALAEEP
jgi:hypothetical protein